MDIDNLIEDFLENGELAESSKPIYENVLRIFGGYFRIENKRLSTISYQDIFESLDMYIDDRNIKYENTARLYISAIREFIIYWDNKLIAANKELLSIFGSGEFDNKVDEKIGLLINSKKLNVEKKGIEVDSNELEQLINKCDKLIDDFEAYNLHKDKYNSKYNEYVTALALKIIAYTGIKVGLIKYINVDCLNQQDFIRIFNAKKKEYFSIKIPSKMYNQLFNYKEKIRPELINYKSKKDIIDQSLFIDFNLKPIDNGPLNDIIYAVIGKGKDMGSSTARVSKRVIIDMISSGMSVKMIEDLTGYGAKVLKYCQEIVDIAKKKEKNPSEYINNYIKERNSEFSYYKNIFESK